MKASRRVACAFVVVLSVPGCGDLAAKFSADAPAGCTDQVVVEREGVDAANLPADERDYRYERAFVEGVHAASEGKYDQALGLFEEAVRYRPDSTDAIFNLAACHDALGDPARAIHLYQEVLARTPDDPDCYANLGTSFIKMYYREKSPAWRMMALEAWQRSLKLNPQQPTVQAYLAQAQQDD